MTVLLVADGMNFLHRGHFAVPLLTNSDGLPTNAIRGLISILLADIKNTKATHCAVVFDRPGQNFRHRLYPEYKAQRQGDTELRPQVLPCKRLLEAMGIKVLGRRGVEGDDMIGSVVQTLYRKTKRTYIGSNDKDFAAMVNKKVHLLRPKNVVLDPDGVFEHFGVRPDQMVDYLMMLGDKVDNIPGINKVGDKTAAKWLNKHETLASVIKNEKFTPKMKINVENAKPFLSLSRKLITLRTDFLPDLTLDDVEMKGLQPELDRLCKELEFTSTRSMIRNVLR